MRIYTKTPYTESEKGIEQTCTNYAVVMGWYEMRLNSGSAGATGANGKQYRIRLAEPGTPDHLYFKQRPQGMCLLFVEYKTPKNKPTWLQEQKMIELREHGAICFVTHSLEEFKGQLKTIDK